MFRERPTEQKATVAVTIIGCIGIVFALVYLFLSPDMRERIDRFIDGAVASAVEVVRHKESGEYYAKLGGGRLVKLSGREEAEAIEEHGVSACTSCE